MNNQTIKRVESLASELTKLSPNALCIVSPTSLSKLDDTSKEIILSHSYMMTNEMSYELLSKSDLSRYTEIIGIGGGTAIDYAKFIAYKYNQHMIAIPSMLSTNVFATNKVAMTLNNTKSTVQGVLPYEVWVDYHYLNKSTQENLYGLVDVFSIFTASQDWRVAKTYTELPIDSEIFNSAQQLLSKALTLAKTYGSEVPTEEIFDVVTKAGYITNDYGSGRPESGSEHIFASAIETKMKIPHALAVTLGIFIMVYTHDRMPETGYSIIPNKESVTTYFSLDKLGIIDDINKLHIKYDFIYNIATNLVPRKDKYTVVDLFANKRFFEYEDLKQHLIHNGLIF